MAGMVRSAGFEPTTTAFGGQYSIQLSYERMVADAVPSQRLIPRERSIAELPQGVTGRALGVDCMPTEAGLQEPAC
jgi:hypothetical protein